VAATHVPDAARRLIAAALPSVPHLEALVLAHAHPERLWDASALVERLYVPESVAQAILADLVTARLPAFDADTGTARYAPGSSELDAAVDALVRHYSTHVVEISRLIHTNASGAVQRLADAFRLPRKP
jgi:hypothetical protein